MHRWESIYRNCRCLGALITYTRLNSTELSSHQQPSILLVSGVTSPSWSASWACSASEGKLHLVSFQTGKFRIQEKSRSPNIGAQVSAEGSPRMPGHFSTLRSHLTPALAKAGAAGSHLMEHNPCLGQVVLPAGRRSGGNTKSPQQDRKTVPPAETPPQQGILFGEAREPALPAVCLAAQQEELWAPLQQPDMNSTVLGLAVGPTWSPLAVLGSGREVGEGPGPILAGLGLMVFPLRLLLPGKVPCFHCIS